jgi:CheY-like chemotaxis protein
MLDSEEIRWVKSTANELNNLLQVINDSSRVLENLGANSWEFQRYFAILRNGVERATKVTGMMADRVGGIGNNTAATTPPAVATVTPPRPGADVQIHNPNGARELLMIVDDEDFVMLLAKKALVDEDYRVVTAKDGFQAIETYRKLREKIALIILDFSMPLMDGSDVFTELLDLNPRVPVLLSSGFAEQERLSGMTALGLRGFIPKPYTHDRLLTEVRSTLRTLHEEAGRMSA